MKHKQSILLSFLLMIAVLSAVTITTDAHAGRTDGNGGHYDHSTGDYHYHHGYPAHEHYDMDGDGDIDCPYAFDDQTDHSPGGGDNKESGDRFDKSTVESIGKEAKQKGEDVSIWIFIGVVVFFALVCCDSSPGAAYSGNRKSRKSKESRSQKSCSSAKTPSASIPRDPKKKTNNAAPPEPKPAEKETAKDIFPEIRLDSSCIDAIEFCKGELYITFKATGKYCYYNVPRSVYDEFMKSQSKGRFFHQNISGKYPSVPVG